MGLIIAVILTFSVTSVMILEVILTILMVEITGAQMATDTPTWDMECVIPRAVLTSEVLRISVSLPTNAKDFVTRGRIVLVTLARVGAGEAFVTFTVRTLAMTSRTQRGILVEVVMMKLLREMVQKAWNVLRLRTKDSIFSCGYGRHGKRILIEFVVLNYWVNCYPESK